MERNSKERLKAVLSNFDSRGKELQKKQELQLSPDEIRYRSLLVAMENYFISFRQATKIVGGTVRLNKLLCDGVVRGEKPDGCQNKPWLINAADCYRNVKPRLNKIV